MAIGIIIHIYVTVAICFWDNGKVWSDGVKSQSHIPSYSSDHFHTKLIVISGLRLYFLLITDIITFITPLLMSLNTARRKPPCFEDKFFISMISNGKASSFYTFSLLVPRVDQTPKPLDPTPPVCISITYFVRLSMPGKSTCPSSATAPLCDADYLLKMCDLQAQNWEIPVVPGVICSSRATEDVTDLPLQAA